MSKIANYTTMSGYRIHTEAGFLTNVGIYSNYYWFKKNGFYINWFSAVPENLMQQALINCNTDTITDQNVQNINDAVWILRISYLNSIGWGSNDVYLKHEKQSDGTYLFYFWAARQLEIRAIHTAGPTTPYLVQNPGSGDGNHIVGGKFCDAQPHSPSSDWYDIHVAYQNVDGNWSQAGDSQSWAKNIWVSIDVRDLDKSSSGREYFWSTVFRHNRPGQHDVVNRNPSRISWNGIDRVYPTNTYSGDDWTTDFEVHTNPGDRLEFGWEGDTQGHHYQSGFSAYLLGNYSDNTNTTTKSVTIIEHDETKYVKGDGSIVNFIPTNYEKSTSMNTQFNDNNQLLQLQNGYLSRFWIQNGQDWKVQYFGILNIVTQTKYIKPDGSIVNSIPNGYIQSKISNYAFSDHGTSLSLVNGTTTHSYNDDKNIYKILYYGLSQVEYNTKYMLGNTQIGNTQKDGSVSFGKIINPDENKYGIIMIKLVSIINGIHTRIVELKFSICNDLTRETNRLISYLYKTNNSQIQQMQKHESDDYNNSNVIKTQVWNQIKKEGVSQIHTSNLGTYEFVCLNDFSIRNIKYQKGNRYLLNTSKNKLLIQSTNSFNFFIQEVNLSEFNSIVSNIKQEEL